ncbi:hypothetical protein H0H92_000726 [Tricholoma furcatifolium]|nr:hypothetical protein H0H92_000726 [Tricholoma furcatifolium]
MAKLSMILNLAGLVLGISLLYVVESLPRELSSFLITANHDNQANISHYEEILREQKVAPLSYTRLAPPGVGGFGGPGNYWVPVYNKKTDTVPVLILWFFDSRGGFSLGANSTRIDDWVDISVAEWIASETQNMNVVWGPAENRAALVFVHIPPHIATGLQENLNSEEEPGLNADSLDGGGSVQATTIPTDAGNDDPFWLSVNTNIKNLHAVISGHGERFVALFKDHGDEWCARDTAKDAIFCFGKHSGYGGYTEDGWGYGVRNLVFNSTDPTEGVSTWIRMEDGETHAWITLNQDYN